MPAAEDVCPYVGLQPYTDADRDYFFGRERDQRVISSNLYAASLTILYGESGVGKSSVLLAGVVPYLRCQPRSAVVVFREWQRPDFLDAIKSECLKAVDLARQQPLDIAPSLPFDDLLCTSAQALGGSILVLFDQFEEYFLYHPDSGAGTMFDSEFTRAVNREDVDVGFLVAIREDALSKLDRFRARIPSLLGNTLRLQHLSAADAEAAIRKPLDVFNARASDGASPVLIEDELVRSVLAQVRTGQVSLGQSTGVGQAQTGEETNRIEAPFLQLVMTRLWGEERKTHSHMLRASTLERLGGAQQIVASHLDSVMVKLDTVEQEVCSRFFDRLVTPSGSKIACGADDLTKWAGDLASHVPAVLQTLADSRLLRGAAASAQEPQAQRFEIFHDVLAPAVLTWRTRYIEARERAEAERRVEEQRRRAEEHAKVAKRLRRLSLGLLAVVVLAIGAASYAWVQRDRAESERQNAESLLDFLLGEKFLGKVREVGRSTMLEQVQKEVERSGSAGEQSPALLRGLALRNNGDLKRIQGALSDSVALFGQALQVFESLSNDPVNRRETARTNDRLGEALAEQGLVTQALFHYNGAQNAWRHVVSARVPASEIGEEERRKQEELITDCTSLADSLVSAGDLRARRGDATGALTDLEKAFRITSSVLFGPQPSDEGCGAAADKAEPYPDAKALEVLSRAALSRVHILRFENDREGSCALAIQAKRLNPHSISAKLNAVVALAWRGNDRSFDDPQSAFDDYREVLAQLLEFLHGDPNNRLWQRERAATQLLVSEGMLKCRESEAEASKVKVCKPMPSVNEAEAMTLEAIATLRILAQDNPSNMTLQEDLAWALSDYARALAAGGRQTERLATLKEAERILSTSSPDKTDAQAVWVLADLVRERADALAALGRRRDAEATLKEYIGRLRTLIADHQDNATYVAALSFTLHSKAEVLRQAGDTTGALAADREKKLLDEHYNTILNDNIKRLDQLASQRNTQVNDGAELFKKGDYTAALRLFYAAGSTAREYILVQPTAFGGYKELSNIYWWIANTVLQLKTDDDEESYALLIRWMHAAQVAAWLAPEEAWLEINEQLDVARLSLAVFLYGRNRLNESLALAQEAIVVAEALVRKAPQGSPQRALYLSRLANANVGIGKTRRESSKTGWEEPIRSALIQLQEAAGIDTKNPAYLKSVGYWRKYLAKQLDGDGLKEKASVEYGLALEAYQKALKTYQKAARISPDDKDARDGISEVEDAIRELAERDVR